MIIGRYYMVAINGERFRVDASSMDEAARLAMANHGSEPVRTFSVDEHIIWRKPAS